MLVDSLSGFLAVLSVFSDMHQRVESFRHPCECCRACDQSNFLMPNFQKISPLMSSFLRSNATRMSTWKNEKKRKEDAADVSTFRKRVTTSLDTVSALLAGTSACIKRRQQQSSSKLLRSPLANFGIASLKQPLTEPHAFDETPHAHNSMSSICVGDGDSWRLHRS